MIALLFPLLASAACLAADDTAAVRRDKELFVGDWRIASLTEGGERLGAELVGRKLAKEGVLRISERMLTFENPETLETRNLAYRLDPSKSPRQIDIISRNDRILPGIYQFDGDRLILCVQSQETGDRPDKFEAPQGSNRILVSLALAPASNVAPVPTSLPVLAPPDEEEYHKPARDRASQFSPEVRRAHELLAGNWDIVSMVDDGDTMGSNLIRAKFAERNRIVIGTRTARLTSPVTGERRISAIQIDPTKSPSQVNVTDQFDQVLKGIYKFNGDHLNLCLAKSEDDDRPTGFEAPGGSNRMLFDLKMAPATPRPEPRKDPLPEITTEVVKARPMVKSVDSQVNERLIGSWKITDRKGTLTFVIRPDGSFTATRAWRQAMKRLFQGGDTTSSGRWSYTRGILTAEILRTTDFSLAGHVLYNTIHSIGDSSMVMRSDMGELVTATKLR
ncbi:TIGR03067 domain-containing protein [Isosphaeraceae bacterium EP7]